LSDKNNEGRGFLEQRIYDLWENARAALEEGKPYGHFIAQADAEILIAKQNLRPGEPVTLANVVRAEAASRVFREILASDASKIENYRSRIMVISDRLAKDLSDTNRFLFQTLILAHGAIVLATLAYLGQSSSKTIQQITSVIAICGIGFFLALLSGHIAILTASSPLKKLAELSEPFLSSKDRKEKAENLPSVLRRFVWPPRILSYLSTICLAAALIVGYLSLSQGK